MKTQIHFRLPCQSLNLKAEQMILGITADDIPVLGTSEKG